MLLEGVTSDGGDAADGDEMRGGTGEMGCTTSLFEVMPCSERAGSAGW